MNHPERRLMMTADMERYSRRGNLLQVEAQRAFRTILDSAAVQVGLDRPAWTRQPTGDGELAILPTNVPEPVVLARLVPEIDRLVREYNRSRLPEAKVRLRIAVHQGLVHVDGDNGFPGNSVIDVCRLLDAEPLKKVLRAFPNAGVALIVSNEIYREVVAEYYDGLRPERFRQVSVSMPDKGFHAVAWIYVVDEDVNTAGDVDDPPAPEPPPTGPPPTGPSSTGPSPTGPPPPVPTPDGGDIVHNGDVHNSGISVMGHGASVNASGATFGRGERR